MEQPTFNQRVAGEIRAEMGRQDISQARLAAELGWAQSQLSRRLRGMTAFNTDEIERIADQLDVPIRQLVSPQPVQGLEMRPAGDRGRLLSVAGAGRAPQWHSEPRR